MTYRTNSVLGAFLFFSIIFWTVTPGYAPAQTASKSDVPKQTIDTQTQTVTILFDKPFQVGQRITIDKYDGIVENVGFGSTQIRALTGHLVTIPNEKLVNSSVENIGERPYIRWLTDIGITYDTPPDKVEKAVHMIREILENHEVMKVLTIIATIFIPITFVAGIYGMNFKVMPELEWRWGYVMVWAIIVVIAGIMIGFFKKKQWI